MSFDNQLTTMLRARVGNIWVQTKDEYRAETLVLACASKAGYTLKCWRASVGLFDFLSDGKDQDGRPAKIRTLPEPDPKTSNPVAAAQLLYSYENNAPKGKGKGPTLVIFEDVAEFLKAPAVARWFKDIALKNRSIARDRLVQVVVLDSAPPVEGFVNVDLDLPTREELTSIVAGMGVMAGLNKDLDPAPYVDVVSGLEATQAQRALAQCLAEKKGFDLRTIMRAKKSLIKDAAAITWIEPPDGGLDVVGGLDFAKDYLRVAERMFRKARDNSSVKRPKGFIACGVPGTGKTYLSHAVGAAWGLPVLEFSVEAAMGGIVGETEKNVDKALEIARACAPCVLCFDELEKGLAGSGGDGRTDGGVMNRVIGRILKFLQDTTEPVFVVVTMNDPLKLQGNPELFRRGRLDKVFWVDVPNRKDRLAVLKIHAKSKGVAGVDLGILADATRNFTGAELEAVLDEATWLAQYRSHDVTLEECLEAVKGVVPVVESWGGVGSLAETREWAKKGTVAANHPEQEQRGDDGQAKVDFDLDLPTQDPEPETPLNPVEVLSDLPVFDPDPSTN